jgi:hypothetical protein
MVALKNRFITQIFRSFADLAPMVSVILIFQFFIIKQPIPDLINLISGILFIVLGLTLFIQGLEQSLFPIGESMAQAFAQKGSLFWLLCFSFCLGFSTTIAEPALIAIANEAATVAQNEGLLENSTTTVLLYALGLRITVAISVGLAILIGVLRIIHGWKLHHLIIYGYLAIVIITPFAPKHIIGIAYDTGGVTTSTITVPLVTALGIGLAKAIKGRNPMTDGFGLIAFASLTPIIFVMLYGMLL